MREFDGYELENKRFFEKESNSIWYLITMPADGLLMFDIKASGPNDDWDFILFEHKSMFCKRIADKKIAPVRTNLSRSPTTGLSRKGRTAFVGAGLNDSYSTPIRAKKGQKFVLVVNNPKKAGKKHTLILHLPKAKVVKEKETIVKEKPKLETMLFKVSIKDAVSNQLVPSLSLIHI